ncbi:MAG: hypothetical protein IPI53_09095 [Saprospiraceae bacterium]|nr:hypothetical protein [Saprospiraceae bacterium]
MNVKNIMTILVVGFLLTANMSCMKGDTFEEQIDQIKDFMARKTGKLIPFYPKAFTLSSMKKEVLRNQLFSQQ